jgi:hypothetical protein
MKFARSLSVAFAALFSLSAISSAQTWTPLHNQPSFAANTAMLLTDGTVMAQNTNASDWWRLTPDNTGSYVNGTWKKVASLPPNYAPLYHSVAVLADGRLIIEGGEYNGTNTPVWTNQGAIYDPKTDKWTMIQPPAGWANIGDAESIVLPDGTYVQSDSLSAQQATFNNKTFKWTVTNNTNKADGFDEEGWLLLPNGKVLTVDAANAPNSEIYDPTTKKWTSAGSTIVRLSDPSTLELGPMVLRPDGTVFATGCASSGVAHTAIYDTKTGKWKAGPSFPKVNGKFVGIGDGPGALLPSGNVLLMASPGVFGNGVVFFEWNGTKLATAPNVPGAASEPSYVGDMLVLPTGQILLTQQSTDVEIYTAKGTANPAWAPAITSAPASVTRGNSYVISGKQFNGLSQGAMYGDDTQAATNYPLVRITNNATKHVFYAKTHNHSSMGVATGSAVVSTTLDVPAAMETGASSMVVVANGIASVPVNVTVN